MDIGKSIYKELAKMSVDVPYTRGTRAIPMVSLAEIKYFLDTLKLEVTGGSGQQVIEVEFLLDE